MNPNHAAAEGLVKPGKERAPILVQTHPSSDRGLILFGGIKGGLGIPVFEFMNLTKGTEVNKVFVRDLRQAWYHQGLEGVGHDFQSVADHLRGILRDLGVRHLVCIGNSMGGYAAILFGVILDADIALAFSPQTFIDRDNRRHSFDWRWHKQIKTLHESPDVRIDYMDLAHALRNFSYKTAIHIHYSRFNLLDRRHALHMKDLPYVELHPHAHGGHKLVRAIRDSGHLKMTIDQALQGTGARR